MTKNLREEYEKIIETMNHYYQAQAEGNSEILKPVCHKNAIMHGFAGETLLEGSIDNLFAFIDRTGKQPDLKARFDVIALEETVATVHCCLEGKTNTYSDFFQLLKINGEWKIISKVFHQYR